MLKVVEKEDIAKMCELAEAYYGGSSEMSNEEYLSWQYIQNPFGNVLGLLMVEPNGDISGKYVVLPVEYSYAGQVLKGSCSLNTLTHPEHQGKGVFSILATATYQKCLEAGIQVTHGFPNLNSYNGFIKRLSFKDMGRIPFLIKPFNFSVLINSILPNRYFSRFLAFILQPCKLYFLLIPSSSFASVEITEIYKFTDEYEEFWDRYKILDKVTINRTVDFMNWRYFQCPTRVYRVFTAKHKERIVAVIVLGQQEFLGVKTGLIVDFLTLKNKEGMGGGEALVKMALQVNREAQNDLAGCLISELSTEAKVLRKMGFRTVPQRLLPIPVAFIVKLHSEKIAADYKVLYDLDNWFITLGTFDVG